MFMLMAHKMTNKAQTAFGCQYATRLTTRYCTQIFGGYVCWVVNAERKAKKSVVAAVELLAQSLCQREGLNSIQKDLFDSCTKDSSLELRRRVRVKQMLKLKVYKS